MTLRGSRFGTWSCYKCKKHGGTQKSFFETDWTSDAIVEYEKGKRIAFYQDDKREQVVVLDRTPKIKKAEITFSDGSIYTGLVEKLPKSSNSENRIWVYIAEKDMITHQDNKDFLEVLGKKKEDVFPYETKILDPEQN